MKIKAVLILEVALEYKGDDPENARKATKQFLQEVYDKGYRMSPQDPDLYKDSFIDNVVVEVSDDQKTT